MNIEDRIRHEIGNLVMQNLALQVALAEAHAKIAELSKPKPRPKAK